MAKYYAQRSDAGLQITEATTISEQANGWNESPGIYTDAMTEGWKHTVDAVHENNWPLAEPADMLDWYSPAGSLGYTDFSTYSP